MGQPTGFSEDVQYAEDITLLSVLNELPEIPRRNSCSGRCPEPRHGESRKLSAENERGLVSTLAFLSSLKKDPHVVTAVCVEEKPDKLEVMVAVNVDYRPNKKYLARIKDGFDRIFEVLKPGERVPREELKAKVFDIIVSLCRSRIRARARISKGKIANAIERVLQGLPHLRNAQNKENFDKLDEHCRELAGALKQYPAENRSSTEETQDEALKLIVHCCHSLTQIPDFQRILEKDLDIVNGINEPSAREALVNTVTKLAWYKVAASRLVSFARHFPIVRRASTKTIHLDDAALRRPPGESTFLGVLDRVREGQQAGWNMGSITEDLNKAVLGDQKLQKGQTFQGDFQRAFKEWTTGSKIHAEIQLVWYLEANTGVNRPRVIASHKHACYLCNAFKSLETEYIAPGTHGMIYPGWRLPSTRMSKLRRQFVDHLELKIERRVEAILDNKICKARGNPRESDIPSTIGSMETMLTASSKEDEEAGEISESDDGEAVVSEEAVSDMSDSMSDSTIPSGMMETPSESPPETEDLGHEREEEAGEDAGPGSYSTSSPNPPDAALSPNSPLIPSSSPSPVSPSALAIIPEKPEAAAESNDQKDPPWTRLKRGRVKRRQLSKSLKLYVEYRSESPTPKTQTLGFRARCLSAEETEDLRRTQARVYDLENLERADCGLGCRQVNLRLGQQFFRVDLDEFVRAGEAV